MPVLAVVGAGFSLLHQSSLGATYGIIKARPVWYKPTMPLMFIAQAIATSPLLVAALTIIVSRLGGRPCPTCIGSKCHLLATIYGVLND